MNGILGMVDLLESSELTLDQQQTVRTVKHSSNALVRIIDDVLDLAKLEAAKLELRMEPAQFLPFLESAIDSFRSYAATKNVVLTFWYDPDLPNWVTCDVGRLRQIVLNLLSNAIKFSATDPNDPKGNVAVHIQANDMHQLVISIQDDGVGMDAKTQCHIFEPFSQADNVSTLNYGGTGLGLPIVHNLLANMQGQIDVESRPGEGSLFVARLPIVSPSGQLDIPVLKGWRILCFVPYQNTKDMLLPTLQATGVVIDWVENADDYIQKFSNQPLRSVALVLSLANGESPLSKVLAEKFPNQRHIFAAR
jgi:signal transduction histidine kinase